MGDDTASAGHQVKWADGDGFAITPLWVLRSDVTSRAKELYAVLASLAGLPEQDVTCTRERLADDLRCSMATFERTLSELKQIGAVTVVERRGGNGCRLPSSYTVHLRARINGDTSPMYAVDESSADSHTPPAEDSLPLSGEGKEADPCLTGEGATRAVPGLGDLKAKDPVAAHTDRPVVRGAPWKVDRTPVTAVEDQLARYVLSVWNDETGQSLTSRDWLAKIVMRAREHPELTSADHAFVLVAALADPWWSGPASPSVVYGNGAQFERCLTAARGESGPTKRVLRYGRGVTSTELVERALRSKARADAEARGGSGDGAVHGGLPARDVGGPVRDVVAVAAGNAGRAGGDGSVSVVDRQRAADADDRAVPGRRQPGALPPPRRRGTGDGGAGADGVAGRDAGVGVGVVVDEEEWRSPFAAAAGAARQPLDGDLVR